MIALSSCSTKVPADYKKILLVMYCDQTNEEYMFNNCKHCKFDIREIFPLDSDIGMSVILEKWKRVGGFLEGTEKNVELQHILQDITKNYQL